MDSKLIQNIANFLTDDPDVFNEMAVSTGDVAMGMGNPAPKPKTRKRRRKRKTQKETDDDSEYKVNPVTGQPEKGEVLYSDTQSDQN